MNLNPVDLRVDKLSEGRGLGHFPPSGTVNRRTLVFKREPNGWKIVHRATVRRYSGRDFSDGHMAEFHVISGHNASNRRKIC